MGFSNSQRLVACVLLMVAVSNAENQPVQGSQLAVSARHFCSDQIVSTCCRNAITECTINMAAYGYDDSAKYGYLITSGGSWDETYAPNKIDRFRGVTLFELDFRTCTTRHRQRFDTYASATDRSKLVNTLEWAPTGTIIIGISADSAENDYMEFQKIAGPFFSSYNMDLSGLKVRDKLAFILQKGYPRKTVFQRRPRYGDSLRMKVVVRGSTVQGIAFHQV